MQYGLVQLYWSEELATVVNERTLSTVRPIHATSVDTGLVAMNQDLVR